MTQSTLNELWHLPGVKMAHETGSFVICDPPVLNTDRDFVVYGRAAARRSLEKAGFKKTSPSNDGYKSDSMTMFRRGDDNVIFTCKRKVYYAWVKATRLAAHMNLLDKKQRVLLFAYIVDGKYPNDMPFRPCPKQTAFLRQE